VSYPPTILVCFAVEEEAKPFRKATQNFPTVQILITGIGRDNARRLTIETLNESDAKAVLTCGFAGGLNPALPRGTVLFAGDDNFPHIEYLKKAGAKPGSFHCTDRVLITKEEKEAAHEAVGADAVEMESGTIQQLCDEASVPCATVRVISDAADETLPLDFNQLLSTDNTISHAALAKALINSPGRIPDLIRFRSKITECAERLSAVLTDALIQNIQSSP
jgi:nucleoside phosphorylase